MTEKERCLIWDYNMRARHNPLAHYYGKETSSSCARNNYSSTGVVNWRNKRPSRHGEGLLLFGIVRASIILL